MLPKFGGHMSPRTVDSVWASGRSRENGCTGTLSSLSPLDSAPGTCGDDVSFGGAVDGGSAVTTGSFSCVMFVSDIEILAVC